MVIVVLVAVCVACLTGYWWLGRTATPGQRAIEEHYRANKGAVRRSLTGVPGLMGRMNPGRRQRDAEWWTRQAENPVIPEPEEHRQGWRP